MQLLGIYLIPELTNISFFIRYIVESIEQFITALDSWFLSPRVEGGCSPQQSNY